MENKNKTLDEIVIDKFSFNMDNFISLARNYLISHNTIPVLSADSSAKFGYDKIRIQVYFYDDLLKLIIENKTKYTRDLKDILLYGYIGRCKGGKNGIIAISPNPNSRDKNLGKVVERFMSSKYSSFCDLINFDKNNFLIPVKVVTHRKSGERMIGVLNRNKRRLILYGIGSYVK